MHNKTSCTFFLVCLFLRKHNIMTPAMASEKMSKSQICCFYSVCWADQFKSEKKKKTLKSLHQPEEFTIEDKDVKNMIIFV